MTTESFIIDTYEKIKKAIINLDENQVSDIYVISFYKSNIDDDPRRPTLTVGFNTAKFGVDIPVIVHELEYYDEPLNWTKQANPKGQAGEFEDWVNNL